MRSVPEWRGKNDDSAIPPRVKDRISFKTFDCCAICQRPVVGKLRAEFDHIVSLVLGGENRETNIRLICHECHAPKTALDVKLKAKVARVRKRHLGLKKPSKFPFSRNSQFKRKVSGEVVRR